MFNYTKKEKNDIDGEFTKLRIGKIISHVILLIILIVFVTSCWGTVGAGERGVVFSKIGGVKEEVKAEGLYFKWPILEKVSKINVRIQKVQVVAGAASKDIQVVESQIALNFHVDPASASRLYQEVGHEYSSTIIAPAIQEAVKGSVSKFTAKEVITRREEIKMVIKENLAPRLLVRGIILDELNITNFEFSESYDKSIEAKVVAEQDRLKAIIELETTKIEAEKKVVEAEAKATAIKLEADALKANAEVVELRWIEKWNGNVPTYWGSATPFIGLDK